MDQTLIRIQDPTTIAFEFRAKPGKEQRVRLSDPRLATVVHACQELPGQDSSPTSTPTAGWSTSGPPTSTPT
jgi:hypothetical protein